MRSDIQLLHRVTVRTGKQVLGTSLLRHGLSEAVGAGLQPLQKAGPMNRSLQRAQEHYQDEL